MFESNGKLELDCAPTEGATGAATDCSDSLASTQTSSGGGTTDVASVVFLATLSSDDAEGSTVGADSAKTGSGTDADGTSGSTADVEIPTGAGA